MDLHETESIRRLSSIAARRGWAFHVEPTTRFAARITLPDGRRHLLIGADLGLNSSAARRVAEDKSFAASFLARDGLPVVPTHLPTDPAHAAHILSTEHLPLPIVIKPNRAHEARGLTFIHDVSQLPDAFARAKSIDPIVLLQPRDPRAEFRIILFERHVATFEKRPSAPDAPANLAAGACWVDRTTDTARAHLDLARRAMDALGLRFAAVDIFTDDIAAPAPPTAPATILEVNATPGLKALATIPGALDRLFESVADAIERGDAPPPKS